MRQTAKHNSKENFISYWNTLAGKPGWIDLGMGMPPTNPFWPEVRELMEFPFDTSSRADYQPQAGAWNLRVEIAQHEAGRTGLSYGPENIMIGGGALRCFSLVMNHLAEESESQHKTLSNLIELIPTYPLLSGFTRTLSRRFHIPIKTLFPQDCSNFDFTADEIVPHIDQGSVLYLTQPNNPTGRYLAPSVLSSVIKKCEDVGAFVILDEASDLANPTTRDFSDNDNPHVIRIKSLSKDFLLAGLRVGYIVAENNFIETISNNYSFSDGNAPLIANNMIIHYLQKPELLPIINEVVSRKVKYTIDTLTPCSKISHIILPDACYYIFMKILTKFNSWELFERLVAEKINILPGILFGVDGSETWIRLCCCQHDHVLEAGLTSFIHALEKTA